jgi:hypothetical protein
MEVDIKEMERIAKKLEGYPTQLKYACKYTLNELAMRMKGGKGGRGKIEHRANSEFDYQRNKSFLKKITGAKLVRNAKTINEMQSEAGVYSAGGTSKAAHRVAKQEKGGSLPHDYIPLNQSRKGNDKTQGVAAKNLHKKFGTPLDVRHRRGGLKIRYMMHASKAKRPMLIKGKNGKTFFVRPTGKVTRYLKGKSDGKQRSMTYGARTKRAAKYGTNSIRIELEFLYLKTEGNVKLRKKRPFVQKAGNDVLLDLQKIFNREVNRQILRHNKKNL